VSGFDSMVCGILFSRSRGIGDLVVSLVVLAMVGLLVVALPAVKMPWLKMEQINHV
jgi:hypothetical protein